MSPCLDLLPPTTAEIPEDPWSHGTDDLVGNVRGQDMEAGQIGKFLQNRSPVVQDFFFGGRFVIFHYISSIYMINFYGQAAYQETGQEAL